jgi:hypothetical protein
MRQHHTKVLLLAVLVAYCLFTAIFGYSFSQGPNNRNVSVDTTVNITQAPPVVLSVIIDDGVTAGVQNITLNAGTWKNITCNATVRDYNGGSTINNVSAYFFANATTQWNASDDNNTHYTNSNCTLKSFSTYDRNVSCSFLVQYHADMGYWYCNVTAVDDVVFGNASRNGSLHNVTFINALLALNVTTLIDYGDMATGDLSAARQANVTNLGNRNINVSVRGYGNVSGDGLAMYCDISNISIEHEKYNIIGGQDLGTYRNLSSTASQIPNLTITQQTNDSQRVTNTSYWVLYVPAGPFGRCNGTVVFQAETS